METNNLVSIFLLFYILVSTGLTKNLVSKQLTNFVEESRIAQHTIGFVIFAVLLILISKLTNISKIITYSIIGYTWFILSTKLDIHWVLMILLVATLGFFRETWLNEQVKLIETDPNLTDEDKINQTAKISSEKIYWVSALFGITIIGSFLYMDKKLVQYGGAKAQFDIVKYLFY